MPGTPRLPPLLGGVLVGGASRRMGRPKQLLELAGRTFVERVVTALAPVVEEVTLLGGGEVPTSLARLSRLADDAAARGPLAGLLAAFAARPDAAWLVAACDQPWLDRPLLEWLIGQRRADALAVLPRPPGPRLAPFPGIYEPAVLPWLRAAAGRGALQPLGELAGVRTPEVPVALLPALRDADAPADLE